MLEARRLALITAALGTALACSSPEEGASVTPSTAAAPGPESRSREGAEAGPELLAGRLLTAAGEPARGFHVAVSGGEPVEVDDDGGYTLELPRWRVDAPLIHLAITGEDEPRRGAILPAAGELRQATLRLPEGEGRRVDTILADPDPEAEAWLATGRWQDEAVAQWWVLDGEPERRAALWRRLAADIDAAPDAHTRGLMQAAQFAVGRSDLEPGLERKAAAEQALDELGLGDPRWAIWTMALPTAIHETGRWVDFEAELDGQIAAHPQPEVAAYVTYERYVQTTSAGRWAESEAIWAAWTARPELAETFFGPLITSQGPERRLAPGKFLPELCVEGLDGGELCTKEFDGLTLVELWSTTCSGCRAAMPVIDAALSALAEDSISAHFVAIEVYHDDGDVRRAIDELGAPGRHGWVRAGEREAVREAFDTQSVPALILVGPDGRILDSDPTLNPENLEQRLRHWHATLAK